MRILQERQYFNRKLSFVVTKLHVTKNCMLPKIARSTYNKAEIQEE
jgi:hypothetical protein